MEIKVDVIVSHPIDVVFSTYRDRLPELVDLLPNIREIRVIERQDRAGETYLVNEWVGGGDIPAVARAVLSESMLCWTDYATWFHDSRTVEWRTEVHAFPGAITSSGKNRYVAVDEGTRLEIRGDLVCDSSKVPGAPRFLRGTINGAVEKILVAGVRDNSRAIARGIEKALKGA